MSHFTYASGVATATVTARCPECNAVKVVPWDARFKAVNPCCGDKHAAVYLKKLRKVTLTYVKARRGRRGLRQDERAYMARSFSTFDKAIAYAVDQQIPFHKGA